MTVATMNWGGRKEAVRVWGEGLLRMLTQVQSGVLTTALVANGPCQLIEMLLI